MINISYFKYYIFLICCGSSYVAAESAALVVPQSNYAADVAKIAAYLLFIVAFIFVLSWLLKKFGRFQHSSLGNLKVVDTILVGAREKILLIEVGANQIMVGVSPGHIRTLYVLDKPIPIIQKQTPTFLNLALKLQEKWYTGKTG